MSLIFLRLDKIGDLITTLPVDQHPQLLGPPAEPLTWVLSRGLGLLAEKALPPRRYEELQIPGTASADTKLAGLAWWPAFVTLVNLLRQKRPRAVVIFQAPWWASLACWWAGVPLRAGRKSQWHSFLFLNRTLRQSRSLSQQHESLYNQELLEFGLQLQPAAPLPPLALQSDCSAEFLARWNLQVNNFIVVHPGMFGSALNWPQASYNELIAQLIQSTPVVITGTAMDEAFLTQIKARWANSPQVRWLQNQLSLSELLQLLSASRAVIAPSTGVLHLAASLGKPCVGLYSPVLAHHPRRWGPRGPKAIELLPQTDQPQNLQDLQDLSVQEVLCALNNLL